MIKLFNSNSYFKDKKFILRPGDVFFHTDVPIITKTRPIGDSYNVLINLEKDRHWDELKKVNEDDIPFIEKNNKIIWRGASNGFMLSTTRPTRLKLCEKYDNHPNKMNDIGFTHVHNTYNAGRENKLITKNIMSIIEQLKSKFIISIEGGDVATNLKWILYSNSVPIMPKPTICS
jgi:hypothetical protein